MKIIDTVKIITDKYNSRATGALFLLDERQKLIQLYFSGGEIVSVKSRNATGTDAIKELIAMKAIKFQFHDGAEGRASNNTTSTAEIIEAITEARSATTKTQQIPDEVGDKTRELFTDYVGPIADVIFEEHSGKNHSLESLIGTLSSYIDNDSDKKAFINAAKAIS